MDRRRKGVAPSERTYLPERGPAYPCARSEDRFMEGAFLQALRAPPKEVQPRQSEVRRQENLPPQKRVVRKQATRSDLGGAPRTPPGPPACAYFCRLATISMPLVSLPSGAAPTVLLSQLEVLGVSE